MILKGMKVSGIMLLISIACIAVLVSASSQVRATGEFNLAYNPNYQTQTGYPQVSASFTCPCGDSAWSAINGIHSFDDSPRDRWTNYISPNSSDWLALDFGQNTTFNKINLYIYHDGGGVQPPAGYSVEYWNGNDWMAVTNPTYTPTTPLAAMNSTANLNPQEALNSVTFNTVTADQVRVVFINGQAKVGVVEMEVFLENSLAVSFDSNGGTQVNSIVVAYGDSATEPAAPAKEGYTFAGWYADAELQQAFDFGDPIKEDTTLYAKWVQGSNADLSSLTLSSGALSPVFASGTTSYATGVAYNVSSLTVTATAAEITSTVQVRVNGNTYATVAGGSESGVLDLNVGGNMIDVLVTAQNGTTQTYSIVTNRAEETEWTYCSDEGQYCSFSGTKEVRYGADGVYAYKTLTDGTGCDNGVFGDPVPGVPKSCYISNINLSGLTLSIGTLSPEFEATTTNYTAYVANNVGSIALTPISDITATITVNGMVVESGQASHDISLDVGSNPITVVVTSLDGTTTIYTVTVTRAASSNADLGNLVLSEGALNPAFSPNILSYTVAVTEDVYEVLVNGMAPAGSTVSIIDATYGMNSPIDISDEADEGQMLFSFPVTIPENGTAMIEIQVIAEDHATSRSYSILFVSGFSVTDAQSDASGQTVILTFNQPLNPETLAPSAFQVYAGGTPITVTQATHDSSDSKTVYLALSEPLYIWDRITVDIQGGDVIRSVFDSQFAGIDSLSVRNESAVFSSDFSNPHKIQIHQIVGFLNRRHFDVDANGDGTFNSMDIQALLSLIAPVYISFGQ